VYIKDVYYSDVTKKIGFTVSAPIQSNQGSFAGVIVARYNLNNMNSILDASDADLGKTADVYLVDSKYYLISDTLLIGKNQVLSQKIETDQIKKCINGEESSGIFQDYRNAQVYGSYGKDLQTALNKKWCLVAEIDTGEVLLTSALSKNAFKILKISFV